MMQNRIIILFVLSLLFGCTPKTEKTAENQATEPSITSTPETMEQRKARLIEERNQLEEARRIELEKLVAIKPFYTNSDGTVVYNRAEIDPSFTGGEAALNAFLKDNLEFPDAAKEDQLEGTVFVDFIVNTDGKVTEVTATSEIDEEVDQQFKDEALRVVNLMPTWIPGRQNGEAVDVKYSLPITFMLQ